MMKNFWVQKPYALATWRAEVGAVADSPSAIQELLLKVAALGDACEVAIVDASQVRHRLEAVWQQHSRVPCNVLESFAPRASLAWYGRDGEVTTAQVKDPGAVLRELDSIPASISERNTDAGSAMVVTGSLLDYDGSRLSRSIERPVLTFATHSDIWFPFVTGDAHPSWDGERYFDNRELASRHTPRLNDFLVSVADAVVAAGGRWSVEEACVAWTLKPWVTERGIRLDGPVPPLMPPELVDVPWPALDDE